MISGSEYNTGKNEIEQIIIPKLFTQDYSAYLKETELLLSDEVENEKITPSRFTNFCVNEKFFVWLKHGLETSQELYEQRYQQIQNSVHRDSLKNPLLLIFKDPNFMKAEKTPKLYFETYLNIIYSQHIYKGMISNPTNLEESDLVFIYLRINPNNFFGDIYKSKNPLFQSLFESDLNSHFVDNYLELINEQSFIFIDKVIKSQAGAGLLYLRDFKLRNGIFALAWFKAFKYFNKRGSMVNYMVTGSLREYDYFRNSFISHDIFHPSILDMFPVINPKLHPDNLSKEERDIINGTSLKILPKKKSSTKNTPSKNSAFFAKPVKSPQDAASRVLTDESSGLDSQVYRSSSLSEIEELNSLKRQFQSSESESTQSETSFLADEKRHKTLSLLQESPRLFSLDSPAKALEPGIQPLSTGSIPPKNQYPQHPEQNANSQYELTFIDNLCDVMVKNPSPTKKISSKIRPPASYYYKNLILNAINYDLVDKDPFEGTGKYPIDKDPLKRFKK